MQPDYCADPYAAAVVSRRYGAKPHEEPFFGAIAMGFRSGSTPLLLGCATLAACLVATEWAMGELATGSGRLVYNPVTGKSVPRPRRPVRAGAAPASVETQPNHDQQVRRTHMPVTAAPAGRSALSTSRAARVHMLQPETRAPESKVDRGEWVDQEAIVQPEVAILDDNEGAGCDGDCEGAAAFNAGCCDAVAICDEGECGICMPRACWTAGVEAVFLKPQFENNVAFTVIAADGASFETFSDTEFNYDLELTPRVWIGRGVGDGIDWRATWWQIDHNSRLRARQPAIPLSVRLFRCSGRSNLEWRRQRRKHRR